MHGVERDVAHDFLFDPEPFGPELFDLELTTERLTTERLTTERLTVEGARDGLRGASIPHIVAKPFDNCREIDMKAQIFEKMESMFPLIAHDYHEISPVELILYQLARGNTFNMRVVGLEAIKKLRKDHPDCSITFKPTHFSEADFILLSLLFRENGMRVLTEGGSNLFIDDIDLYSDLLPKIVDPAISEYFDGRPMSLSRYFSTRGAFKVFRNPVTIPQEDGTEIQIGLKDILLLSRAYRQHLVKEREMYVTFPGYSRIKTGLLDILKKDEEKIKTGRSYSGKIDGFLHLPFQMDLEASQQTGVDVYVVGVNIAYSPVLEDENFSELIRLSESGVDEKEIYRQDLSYIISAFCNGKTKGDLSIKFSEPVRIDTLGPKENPKGTKNKKVAQKFARDIFEKTLSMQPVFPANIYFSAFDRKFSDTPTKKILERIDDRRQTLQTLLWGKEKKRVDLHYILDYKSQIISAEEIVNRTFDTFNAQDKQITRRDGARFVVLNADVATQYRNHTAHFF